MNDITHTDAILFPADGRTPHLVPLMSSTVTSTNPTTGRATSRRVPHPQVHMNYIATNTPYQVWDSRVRSYQDSTPLNLRASLQVITNISYARWDPLSTWRFTKPIAFSVLQKLPVSLCCILSRRISKWRTIPDKSYCSRYPGTKL